MPLFDYVCQQCEHGFEALLFGDEQAECPQCKSKQVEQQLSLPAKPRAESALPMTACQSSGPPCGSMCSRWGK